MTSLKNMEYGNMEYGEEEEYEVQSIIKVYPMTKSAMILWSDDSLTLEPLEHLTHCDDCLLTRLNDLLDRNREEEQGERDLIIKILERK